IIFEKGSKPTIIREFCEGCTACMKVCPRNAIMIEKTRTGQLSAVETLYGINVVTGDLEVGGRNSGEIVFTAREEAKKLAEKIGKRTILIDCAPGIGCPVVSSLSGADLLLLVVEPIPQSLQGAKRILKLAESFRLETYCILNKYDLNEEYSEKIPEELGLEMIGKIPYDESVVESYTMMRPIVVDSGENPVKTSLINLFENLTEELSK
ncbi:MAG: (4Fe-4S)-binding protein, partial [Candidatus Wolframiiraptor sp.]